MLMHKQYTKIDVKVACKKINVKIKLNRPTKNKQISKVQSD